MRHLDDVQIGWCENRNGVFPFPSSSEAVDQSYVIILLNHFTTLI